MILCCCENLALGNKILVEKGNCDLHLTAPVVPFMMSATTLVGRIRTFVISHLESASTEFAGDNGSEQCKVIVLIIQIIGKRSMQDFWTTRSAS